MCRVSRPKLTNLIKLNTNENPYGPSLRALEAMRQEVANSIRLYPDPASDQLREANRALSWLENGAGIRWQWLG